jgi:4-hydroxybenzoyl-CoA thioesterase
MSRQIIYSVNVEFGDCDPARIVWFPNFFRWIDAASRHFFVSCGLPPWHELEKSRGIIGTPIVNTEATFIATASYGDRLDIRVSVTEWRTKSFVQHYEIFCGSRAILECTEVRIFAGRRSDDPEKIRALAVPEDIQKLCSALA